jgi:ATP/maltotriose-dependent transcriptional regulator MalT
MIRGCREGRRRLSGLDPTVQATLLAAVQPRSESTQEVHLPEVLSDGLTRREAEILAMIARGVSNPDIVGRLSPSPHTVKSHTSRIFANTRTSDRAAAIRYATELHSLDFHRVLAGHLVGKKVA